MWRPAEIYFRTITLSVIYKRPTKCLQWIVFSLFADDTTITFSDSSLKICLNTAQTKLVLVFDWFVANKLTINFNKRYYILFGNSFVTKDALLLICNHTIIRVENKKFWSIFIDEKLNWGSHLEYLCSKLAKSVELLKVASLYISGSVLMTMFHAFIMSHFHYGFVICGNTFNSYLHPIHMMYIKAIRIISPTHPLSHIYH